ncbi:hypothetical protein ENUP19_0061G0129 [Entamoeba nuttalli]|uniref:Iron-sulfur cluster-binding protein, putative n=2 Tax=Entamoeba nuttalli TaxID=412467 RepID=K2G8H1_ENTNP|nr:iron-sulfur cluster-binding protein, putative [Entamoeba nuttalli P19]EKE38711.1 iron-sulfur cluster-binding protein, putative [Entamoeba nuttalli P19]|eukprot:XP_008858964.1 iron-sulfur cluster-binding protein, putative [Entamoeba nuttalli P19]
MQCPVQVSFNKCIGCLQCIRVCPTKVLTSTHMKSTVSFPERCISCGCCSSVCPVGAIIFNGVSPQKIDVESFGDVIPVLKNTEGKVNSDDEEVPKKLISQMIEKAKYSIQSNNYRKLEFKVLTDVDPKYHQLVCTIGTEKTYDDDVKFLSTLSLILIQNNIHYEWTEFTDPTQNITCALAIGRPKLQHN